MEPKQVVHHSNTSNPSRCFVQLFKKYCQHCPTKRKTTAFYLTPLKKPKGNIWYAQAAVGHNTLSQTVKRLCKAAGISGFKTNHSLRVTTASRLFQKGVDEQLIMGRTGHRSFQGLRTYKRVSNQQKRDISDLLNSDTNGEHCNTCQPEPKKIKCELESECLTHNAPLLQPATLNFTGCSSITINYFTKQE